MPTSIVSEPDESKKNWRMFGAFVFSAMAVLLSLAVAGLALVLRFDQAHENAQRQQRTWHVVICRIEAAVAADKTIPRARKVYAVSFYDDLLINNIGTTPCRIKIPQEVKK